MTIARRDFIATLAGAAAAPLLAPSSRAQQGAPRRIGALIGYTEDDPETKSRIAALRSGLAKRGWSEGRNIVLDFRFVADSAGRFQALAKELVALQPEVILGHTTPAVAALQRETATIPVVFVNVSDPIGSGFIAGLARPGGNLTGVQHYEAGIVGKWLAMLKEIAPRLTRAAVLGNPKTTPYGYFLRSAEALAASLGLDVVPQTVETDADVKRAVGAFAGATDTGLIALPDATTILHRDLIVALAAQNRVPTVYPFSLFVAAGGLMSYGTDQPDMFRMAAFYVDRILRGDKPADLPVQAPTRYETFLNLKTAQALDLAVPPTLLVRADEVIE